jgi:hypothetical protein
MEHKKSRNFEKTMKLQGTSRSNQMFASGRPLGTMVICDTAALIDKCSFHSGEIHLEATFHFEKAMTLVDETILVLGEDDQKLHTSTLTGNFSIATHDTLTVTIDLQLHGLFKDVERWVNVGI